MQLLFDHIFGNKQNILNLDLNRYMFNPLKGLNCMFVTVVNTRHPYWRGSNIIYIYILLYTCIYIYTLYIYIILRGEDLFFHMVLQEPQLTSPHRSRNRRIWIWTLAAGGNAEIHPWSAYIYIVYIWKTTILLMGKSTINGLYIYMGKVWLVRGIIPKWPQDSG